MTMPAILFLLGLGVIVSAFWTGLGGIKSGIDGIPDSEDPDENGDEAWYPIHSDLDLEGNDDMAYLVPGSYAIPDGQMTIREDGSFSGQWIEDKFHFGDFFVDQYQVEGRIAQDGSITGTYSGIITDVVGKEDTLPDELTYEFWQEEVEGSFSGQIAAEGSWNMEWTGAEPGSQSGQLPTGNISNDFAVLMPELVETAAA